MVKSPRLNEKSSDFDEIWHITAALNQMTMMRPNYENFYNKFKTADGRHNENRFWPLLSSRPI